MILADTSVWVNHFRQGESHLQEALVDGKLLIHPFVVGEIACGNLRGRVRLIHDLRRLPSAVVASHEEVLALLEHHRLFGTGLGWIDAHLLASARLTGCQLWTLDGPLRAAAAGMKVSYSAVM
jgi:predicted nucleic acid-binding protein